MFRYALFILHHTSIRKKQFKELLFHDIVLPEKFLSKMVWTSLYTCNLRNETSSWKGTNCSKCDCCYYYEVMW